MVFTNNLIHKIVATRSHQVDPDEYGDIGNKKGEPTREFKQNGGSQLRYEDLLQLTRN